jgi:ribosomal protein L24
VSIVLSSSQSEGVIVYLIRPVFFFLLFVSLANSQVISVKDAETIQTKQTITTNRIIVDGVELQAVVTNGVPSEPVRGPVTLVTIDTDAANVRVTIEDADRIDVSAKFAKLSDKQYATTRSGKYWFRVLAVDFPKNIFVEETKVFEVKGVDPEPSPPDEDSKFAGLAKQVAEKAAVLPQDQRLGLAKALELTAEKMSKFELRTMTDAAEFLRVNRPTCDSVFCPWLSND